jgi:hypothetical protein
MGLVHKSCLYEIPNGAAVESDGRIMLDGKLLRKLEPCAHADAARLHSFRKTDAQPPTVNGWVEDVESELPVNAYGRDWLRYLGGKWKVPVNPSWGGGLVFLFNGAQDASSQAIIQPVLQWGDNGRFGGNYWMFAGWYGGPLFGNNYGYSTPINVSPNDVLNGFVYAFSCTEAGACSWAISAGDQTTGATTTMYSQSISVRMTLALSGALEAYNITDCNQLPGASAGYSIFSGTTVYQPGQTWGQAVQTVFNGDCGQGASTPCWSDSTWAPTPNCGYNSWSTATMGVLLY